MLPARAALLLLALACCTGSALSQAAPGKPPAAINMTTLLNATHVPIVRFPSLAPTVLELLKLDNVRGDMVQNISKPLKLSELMPKLPTIPTFAAPNFGPNTSDEEIESNVTAAARALMLPLVESTMLPSYIAGLRARVADEAVWLQGFVADKARQDKLCGFFTQYYSNCIVFTANMQKTKIQAIATALDVLTQMEAQLNTDMANKIAAFNVESQSALGSNWMCEVGGDLSTAIREAMAKSSSEAYLAKAKNGLAKINDFVAGRWATSPWWRLSADAQLPKLDTPCPIVQQ